MSESLSKVAGGGARAAGVLLGLVGTAMFAAVVLGVAIHSRDSATQVLPASESAALVASIDRWTPPATVGEHQWRRAEPITGTQQLRDCSDHPIEWTWTSSGGLRLSLVRLDCRTPYAAYEVVDNYAGVMEDVDFPASGEHYTWVYHDEHSAQVVWRQRVAVLALRLTCVRTTPTCITTAATLTKQVDGIAAPSASRPEDDRRIWVLFRAAGDLGCTRGTGARGPAGAAAAVGLRRRGSALSRHHRPAPAPPTAADSAPGAVVGRPWWPGVLFVLSLLDWLIVGGSRAVGVGVAAVVCVVAFLAGRRVDPERRQQARMVARNHGPRGRTGQLLRSWSSVLAATALVGFGVIVLAGGGARTVPLDRLFYNLSQSAHGQSAVDLLRWMFVNLAIGYRDEVTSVIVLAVAPMLVIAYLLRTVGRRLQAADAEALLKADDRPPFLYLRSFDEDELRVPAPSLRTGPVERLIPWRRRTFERVVVDTLSRYGPVFTVSDPRVRLAPIGAARAALPHEAWQGAVAGWAQSSLAVVVGGTPSQVRDGLAYELSMLAGSPRPRLLVIQAPYRRDVLAVRWAGFRHHVADLALFGPLLAGWVQPGTHVLAYDSTRGWTAWGARWRTDRSYALAIEEVVQQEIDVWYLEYQQARRSLGD